MKRGFTLIELLAVIVILGIILAIAVPSVGRIIEESRYNSLLQIEQFVKDSAIKYLAVNNELYPTEIGTTIEIKIDELINKNFLNEVKSPWNNNKCNGYVLITKIEDNNYNFIPHLNCFENITNSVDDKLLLHYTFDDFQEPTKNLNVDPKFEKGISNTSETPDKWHDASSVYTEAIEVTDGVLYHKGTQVGVHNLRMNSPVITFDRTKDYVIQYKVKYIKREPGADRLWVQGSIVDDKSDYSQLQLDAFLTKKEILSDGFEYREYLIPANTFTGSGDTGRIGLWQAWNKVGEVEYYFKDFQVEEKSYQTPYTDGEREGIIKDHSLNNNHASLELNSTPRWINSKFGGAYEFNGIDNYIVVPKPTNFDPSSDFSVSVWVYRRGGRTIISHDKLDDDTTGAFNLYANDTNVQIEKNNHAAVSTKNGTFKSKEWQHIVITYDNNEQLVKFYINGKLIDNKQIEPPKNFENELLIGRRGLATDSFFQGIIDELRIYGRVLSEMEVKLLYKRQK